jgi:hypothetical protein
MRNAKCGASDNGSFFFYSEFRNTQLVGNESSHYEQGHYFPCRIGQFVKLAHGDMDRIPRFHLTDIFTDLHSTLTALDVVNLFHGIHVTNEYFTGGDIGMGEKHQGLKMLCVQNHVCYTTPVRLITGRFHLRVF